VWEQDEGGVVLSAQVGEDLVAGGKMRGRMGDQKMGRWGEGEHGENKLILLFG